MKPPERGEDVPSNADLSQRMERVEVNLEHVVDSVDRIESNLEDDHGDLVERVEATEQKVRPLHAAYRFGKYAVPVAAGMIGTGLYFSPL